MNFYALGYAIGYAVSTPSSFVPMDFKVKSRKQCKTGYTCGGACISTKKKCRIALGKEAKTFAQYVRQNKGKLTGIQKKKAKEQNIGLKAETRIKRQKAETAMPTTVNAAAMPKKENTSGIQNRAEITKKLGDLENTIIPRAIAWQRKAESDVKSAENDLTRLNADKQRYGGKLGGQNDLIIDKSIAEATSKLNAAKKKLEESTTLAKSAQKEKADLEETLRGLPFPKVSPVSLDKITKPLSKEETDLIRFVSGARSWSENVPESVQKIADQFGGINSMRSALKDYTGTASLSMQNFLKATASDPRPPLNRLRSQMKESDFKQKEIALKREIEINNATEKAKKLGMNDEEAAAIISYTTNGYVGMNGYMRGLSLNSDSVTAKYQEVMARATYQAAKKLPDYQGEVKRGSREPESRIQEFEEAMRSGKSVSFAGFTSTSSTKGEIEGGYGKSAKDQAMSGKGLEKASEWQELNNRAKLLQWNPGELKSVSYTMQLKTGKKISQISSQPKEEEVLVLPDSKFKVKAVRYNGEKAEIELEEE